ncbi:ester hydrolase C11orf54 homolog [Formica exsecta]|uniref:ester hydrolase C11orf54 homolog n=1 Tax=Formica exsecta TaxID=72781 RepID=UPI001142E718|nr:ester hydrolase C11orf54 homolog [Formica exsecta]
MGDVHNIAPISQTDLIFDIRPILSSYCYDFFVIGSGFAAKPSMPYNGHLTINAIISANPTNILNNSRIVYEDANTERIRSQTVNDPNQIKCSMFGNFFFSEGRRGMMIKIRAKGRKTIYNLTSLIQYSLYFHCRYPIGLGVVLEIDGGKMLLYITPENYPEWFTPNMDFDRWLKLYQFDCINLIAIGALTNLLMTQRSHGCQTLANPYRFNIFPNYETGGEFCFDMTPDETEYIGYFNIAQRIYF